MHKTLVALAAIALTLSSSCATSRAARTDSPEQVAVMAPVHQFIDGMNVGDVAKATAACSDAMSIIDDFPPHEWHGPGALANWARDFEAFAQRNEFTDITATLEAPRIVDVNGDRAYVVAPASYTFKVHGKPGPKIPASIVVALQKGAAGWRIAGWAWAND